jgi:pimeloyl-ACP methyl ester carboxylesterase
MVTNQAPPRLAEPRIPDSPDLQLRALGAADATRPTLLYLPGLHGDWTLLGPFRQAWAERGGLLEITYPRRADWTLADYARAVLLALRETGIARCWVVGESFSSQVAWELLALAGKEEASSPRFEGMILVGGFVRHPWSWGVRLAHLASDTVPSWVLRPVCRCYGWMARQHARNAEHLTEFDEFVARRTTEADRLAITSRYLLIDRSDPRPVARETRLPVYQLSGAWDPLVPWWQVRAWLRRECPGYLASRILWASGHNVLLSAPRVCAAQILAWVRAATPAPEPGAQRPVLTRSLIHSI